MISGVVVGILEVREIDIRALLGLFGCEKVGI